MLGLCIAQVKSAASIEYFSGLQKTRDALPQV